MAYLLIEDFKRGLDRRRTALTSVPGSLQTCTNAHITRGGEIEKRKAFVDFSGGSLPAGTFGLHSTGPALYVFGSIADPGMPSGLTYQRLQNGTGAAMTAILDTANYNGRIYAIASFDNDLVYHFFNGTVIADWNTIRSALGSNANVATAFAALINSTDDYTATLPGGTNVVRVTGPPGVPWTRYKYTVDYGGTDNQTITTALVGTDADPNASPPTSRVYDFTIGGTFQAADLFYMRFTNPNTGVQHVFEVTGVGGAIGETVITFNGKLYSTAQSLLYFSEINGPRLWYSRGNGAGFIDMANQDGRAESLTALSVYQGQLAVFAPHSIQLWQMDPDPLLNRRTQILSNIGTTCPHSVQPLGELDVFFLADSGVRSLRARDASNAATVSDIGIPIDEIIEEDFPLATSSAQREASIGAIDPTTGRYWLAIGSTIYVYSYFPSGSITAWSKYDAGFNITAMVHHDDLIYLRDDDDIIYCYGGPDGNTYDDSRVEVILPFMDGGKPGHRKQLKSFDLTCEGEWTTHIGCDVSSPTAFDECGITTDSTWSMQRKEAMGLGTHFAVKLIHEAEGAARLGNLALHFEMLDAE